MRSILTALAGVAAVNSLWAVLCALAVNELIPFELIFHTTIIVPCLSLACVVLAVFKRLQPWLGGAILAVCVPFLIYLGWDDSSGPPPSELPRLITEGSKIETAMRWLQKGGPKSRLDELPKDPQLSPDDEEWRTLEKERVSEILAIIENDRLGQEWIRAMSESTPDGIMPPPTAGVVYLYPAAVRTIFRLRWFQAARLSQEGRVDDAARVLIPLIRASHNIRRVGCSLVEQMIAEVCCKGTYHQVQSAARAGTFSSPVREELLNALQDTPSIEENFTLAFVGERALAVSQHQFQEIAGKGEYWFPNDWLPMTVQLGIFGRLVFNPNRSENEYVAFLSESLALSLKPPSDRTQKEWDALEEKVRSFHLKNSIGHVYKANALPAFPKISRHFWETEALRLELIHTLETGGDRT